MNDRGKWETTKRMLKREEKNKLKKDSDKKNVSETVIRNISENNDKKKT